MNGNQDEHIVAGEEIGGGHYIKRTYLTPDGKCISYPAGDSPPEGSTFIGIMDYHRTTDGSWCGGYVHFRNVPHDTAKWGVANHELVAVEPLHIEPSLGCRRCPSHGWIRNGRWVEA